MYIIHPTVYMDNKCILNNYHLNLKSFLFKLFKNFGIRLYSVHKKNQIQAIKKSTILVDNDRLTGETEVFLDLFSMKIESSICFSKDNICVFLNSISSVIFFISNTKKSFVRIG